jgi:23S rRNA pseudouridine1911/1915/1917 synthase
MIHFTPGAEEVGQRADVVLAKRASVTRTLAQRALRSGQVSVGGRQVRPSHRLESFEVVDGVVPDPVVAAPEAEDIPLEIRFSDDRVLVVSKPAGLVTHPARGHAAGTLVNALLGLGEPLSAAGSTRPGIVHRLDKDTSGLLLVAKDDDAQQHLVDAIRAREVERRYLALVGGVMPAGSGTIDAPLGRHPVKRRQMAVVAGGKPAVTHYSVLASTGELSLLEAKLETGRTHQIRVHLAHLGHPVAGDRTYGGASERARALGLTRPFLHAWRLRFPHPDGGRTVEVTDELPDDLTSVLHNAGLEVRRSFLPHRRSAGS